MVALFTTYTPLSLDTSRSLTPTVALNLLGISTETRDGMNDKSGQLGVAVDEMDPFFEKNVDATGNALPHTISYAGLAKRISPFGECFFFDYGVVVMWGLTEQEEKTVLRNLRPFEDEKLSRFLVVD